MTTRNWQRSNEQTKIKRNGSEPARGIDAPVTLKKTKSIDPLILKNFLIAVIQANLKAEKQPQIPNNLEDRLKAQINFEGNIFLWAQKQSNYAWLLKKELKKAKRNKKRF